MTREEAREALSVLKIYDARWLREAVDMAIEALDQEPRIYCKECKYWHEWENGAGSCHKSDIMWVGSDYDDYCSFAEKRGSDGE